MKLLTLLPSTLVIALSLLLLIAISLFEKLPLIAYFLVFLIASGPFVYRRTLRYLRYMQQDEYDPCRFWRWFWEKRAWDRRASKLGLLSVVIAWSLTLISCDRFFFALASQLLLLLGLSFLLKWEKDPRLEGKIKLHFTPRAKRLHYTSLLLFTAIFLVTATFLRELGDESLFQLAIASSLALLLAIQLIPLGLSLAYYLLLPYEKSLQRGFFTRAHNRWMAHQPLTVGITGSYGKTSCKLLLAQVLQRSLGATFWPAKGVNTLMGTARDISDRFFAGYRYGVIEMGAYRQGSIKRLCQLTPPQAALITHIGLAHLERFGSAEAILKAKSELAQALPAKALLVCNGDNAGCRLIASKHRDKTILLYGLKPDKGNLDCLIEGGLISERGTAFTIHWKGRLYKGSIAQYGAAALSNVAGVFAMAVGLGADPELVIATLATLEPVENRLHIRKEGPVTYLNDAYNSNPVGFAAALDLLASYPSKRRLLMTPGMIEFGHKQETLNYEIAKKAAHCCDKALIVGTTNQQSLLKGLIDGGMGRESIVLCATREEAFRLLAEMRQEGDLILIENDLTDLHEDSGGF